MKIGETIAGRYRLEGVLGRGGMSSVYWAHDSVLERDVAVKVLHEQLSGDPDHVERFRREARAIASLSHPNIVTVVDRGQVEGSEFIVFELVRGLNLKDFLDGRTDVPVAQALGLALQAARGLSFAHERGVVHRDVKPQNVLVNDEGVAKVTDFGIARSSVDDELTQTGTILGTSDYLSPEQAVGQHVDERADQYSLGVLLYELLTGAPPYNGESPVAVAMKHVHDPVPSARARRPDVSLRVDALIQRAMAKNPDDRYRSMAALVVALEACLAEEGGVPRWLAESDTASLEPVVPARERRAAAAQASRSLARFGCSRVAHRGRDCGRSSRDGPRRSPVPRGRFHPDGERRAEGDQRLRPDCRRRGAPRPRRSRDRRRSRHGLDDRALHQL